MKISAKILALALALVMVFTFAGCGANPEEQIKGEWTAEVELSKAMEGDDSGFADFLKDTDLTLEFNLEFDDGEVIIQMDASDAVKSDDFRDAVKKYLLDETGKTEEDLEGTDVSLDEYVDETATEFEKVISEKQTDSYKFEDDKLIIGEDEQKYEFKDDNTLILDLEDMGEVEFKKK